MVYLLIFLILMITIDTPV